MKLVTCEICHEEFVPGRSVDAAMEDGRELFPDVTDDNQGIVCEYCWPKFLRWMESKYGPPPWPDNLTVVEDDDEP